MSGRHPTRLVVGRQLPMRPWSAYDVARGPLIVGEAARVMVVRASFEWLGDFGKTLAPSPGSCQAVESSKWNCAWAQPIRRALVDRQVLSAHVDVRVDGFRVRLR
jgi:hypothetical protein